MVVADVARGDGKDYSTFHVIDIENNTQVGEYKGQLGTKEFGHLLVGIATEYNQALLVIENASIGWSTIQTVIERGYDNLYYSPKGGNMTADSYFDQYDHNSNMVAGFSMNARTRPLVIGKFQEYVNEKAVTIHSKRLIEEMKVFVWKNGRAEAQGGYNDLALNELKTQGTESELSDAQINSRARSLYAGEEISKQLDRDIEAANAFSEETGLNVKVEVINNEKELLEKYGNIISEADLKEIREGRTNAFNIDDNTLAVYKPNAIKNGHVSSGSHEVLPKEQRCIAIVHYSELGDTSIDPDRFFKYDDYISYDEDTVDTVAINNDGDDISDAEYFEVYIPFIYYHRNTGTTIGAFFVMDIDDFYIRSTKLNTSL